MKMRWVVGVCAIWLVCPQLAMGQAQDDSQWAPSASFMVGKFDTGQLSSLSAELTGYELDLTGRSWDIGAARGRAGHSYLRITFAQLRIDNGSEAFDSDTRYVTNSMSIKGLRIERLFRFGPARWIAAPVLTVAGGIGKISGSVTKYGTRSVFNPQTRRFDLVPLPPEQKDASEIFDGRTWLPMFGLGVGATASPTPHLTITVGVYGLEFPGTYKGLLQVVYWPR